jgi:hypothetical protein
VRKLLLCKKENFGKLFFLKVDDCFNSLQARMIKYRHYHGCIKKFNFLNATCVDFFCFTENFFGRLKTGQD